MVKGGRGVSTRLLLLLGLVVGAFDYLGLKIWTGRGGALPQTSWGGFIVLLFMAVGVFFAGLPVRRFLRGQAKKPLNPIRAMRTLVLAQAAALAGSLVTGWYLAQILVVLPDLDIASRRTIATRLAALAVGGVLMSVAGLVTQAMCRVDPASRDHDGDPDSAEKADGAHEH